MRSIVTAVCVDTTTPVRDAFLKPGASATTVYVAGVNAANARHAFAAGVRKAGDEKWSRKAIAVGVSRFGPGAAAAQPDFEAGFGKYHAILGSLQVKARGPKGDPGNYAISQAIGDALHKAKLSGGA